MRPRGRPSSPSWRRGLVAGARAWQRCRVHFMRNVLARVPKGSQEMVAAAVRSIFAQPDRAAVAEQLDSIAEKLGRQFPAVESMLREAEVDVCAFACFPQAHWRRIWSTNPLERVIKEVKRRADVVGIFPNELAIAERRYLSEGSMAAILAAGVPAGLAATAPALLAS